TQDRQDRLIAGRHASARHRRGVRAQSRSGSRRVGTPADGRHRRPSGNRVLRGGQSHTAIPGTRQKAAAAPRPPLSRAREVTEYLSVEQVLGLHAALTREFGGASGLRDRGALESAVARPAMTFGGEDLYPDMAAKAAALMHSLVLNDPSLDGNKRVAVA